MTKSFVLCVFASVLTAQVDAFWGKGHLLVARRAEQILTDEASDVLTAALAELETLVTNHPDLVTLERDHKFTECATYADDIKGSWGKFQNDWHFINTPVLDEPGTSVEDFPEFEMPDIDIVQAVTALYTFMKTGVKDDTYMADIEKHFTEEAD